MSQLALFTGISGMRDTPAVQTLLAIAALPSDGRCLVLAFIILIGTVLLPIQGSVAVEPGQDVYHVTGVMGVATDTCDQINAFEDGEKKQTALGEFARQRLIELRGWVDGYMTAMDSLQNDPRKRVANVVNLSFNSSAGHTNKVIERCRQYPWENVASATEATRRFLINEPVESNEALSAGRPRPSPPPNRQSP